MRRLLLLAGLLALGCRPAATAADCPPTPAASPDLVQTSLVGRVTGPRSLFLTDGDAARFLEEVPVTAAKVMLTDATGQPIPGLSTGWTDARGRFVLDRVPVGFAYQVGVAATDRTGRVVWLKAFAQAVPRVVDLTIDTASTLVVESATAGRRGLVGVYETEAYEKAIAILAPTLTNGNLPDLGRAEAVRKAVADYKTANPTFGAYMTRLAEPPSGR